jgi:DNA-binding cell septation regulator SpoVG
LISLTQNRQGNLGRGFAVREWRPHVKNTLVGFASIELPSGLVIHGICLHQKGDSRWVSMPARQYEKGSEKTWAPLVEFTTKDAREKFQRCVLEAIDIYLAEGGE